MTTPRPNPDARGYPPDDPGLRAEGTESVPETVVVVPVEVPVVVTETVIVSATSVRADERPGAVIDAVEHTADEVAALVLSVPGVVRLHSGAFGEVATYLPGRRVTGVKLADDQVEVHVVVANGTPIRDVAQRIHRVVAAVVTAPVHVYVEDLAA